MVPGAAIQSPGGGRNAARRIRPTASPPHEDDVAELLDNLLDLLGRLIMPDWKALIDLIPLVGLPLLGLWTLWAFGRLGLHDLRHRRRTVPPLDMEPPRPAPRLASGAFDYPVNTPFCPRDGLIYRFDAQTCDVDGRALDVRCPVDGTVRPVTTELCRTCGTRFQLGPASNARTLAAAGPPPGGAAAA